MILFKPKPIEKYSENSVYDFKVFAWLPTKLSDGTIILFEYYNEGRQYTKKYPHGENYFLIYEFIWATLRKSRIYKK